MIYEFVPKNDPILKTKTEKFDFLNPPINPVELYNNMGETLRSRGGVGLAAPQVGLPYRFFVLWSEYMIGCFNPIIVDMSDDRIDMVEGCLSFPGLILSISRPKIIKVRYTEPDGNVVTRVFDGLSSRAFQHELDHLDGILFGTRVSSPLKLKLAISKSKTQYLIKEVSN